MPGIRVDVGLPVALQNIDVLDIQSFQTVFDRSEDVLV